MTSGETAEIPKVRVYIDALNLQRQLQVPARLQWLNPLTLSEALFPHHQVELIRYFTAKIKAFPGDQSSAIQQEIYWRALRTIGPRLAFHFGTMRSTARYFPRHPLEPSATGGWERVKILHTEEKGTDVALGSFMVADASSNKADLYALISNDSDFAPTLHILREHFDVKFALVSPNGRFSSALLDTRPAITRVIREPVVAISQFPSVLTDDHGSFGPPTNWI